MTLPAWTSSGVSKLRAGRPPRPLALKCERERKFHRIKTRAAYTCDTCGLQIYPMAGTIFEKSTTSLQLWFYALYLVASTRCGISAKQLERELGVTYKTAYRMMKQHSHLPDE